MIVVVLVVVRGHCSIGVIGGSDEPILIIMTTVTAVILLC